MECSIQEIGDNYKNYSANSWRMEYGQLLDQFCYYYKMYIGNKEVL